MPGTPQPAVDPVRADLQERGYAVTQHEERGPPAIATGGVAPDAFADAPLGVEQLGAASPLTVVARLADNARAGRSTLFVADPDTAASARELLADPFLCRAEQDGCRSFYSIPDRIRLTDDTYACARTDDDLTWREEPADSPVPFGDDGAATDASAPPRLLLEAGDEILAALESVAALECPGPDPDAFPYRYSRGDDKRFHVFDREREVGQYSGTAAMKANAYHPVPLPLVPEHHLQENKHLAEAWGVAVVDGVDVTYHTA
jgi:hypothetical protein